MFLGDREASPCHWGAQMSGPWSIPTVGTIAHPDHPPPFKEQRLAVFPPDPESGPSPGQWGGPFGTQAPLPWFLWHPPDPSPCRRPNLCPGRGCPLPLAAHMSSPAGAWRPAWAPGSECGVAVLRPRASGGSGRELRAEPKNPTPPPPPHPAPVPSPRQPCSPCRDPWQPYHPGRCGT